MYLNSDKCSLVTRKFVKNKKVSTGLLDSSVVNNFPVNSGDAGWIPGPGRSHKPESN